MKLKKDKTVYLYNGKHKANQHSQFAVLDIDIGKKNLVQCADAAIRLRADYLFQSKKFDEIAFTSTSGERLSFTRWRQGYRWKEQNGKLLPIPATIIFPMMKKRIKLLWSWFIHTAAPIH